MISGMGRPRKGDRVAIAAKPERPLAEVIQRNATLLHMSYGDYIVYLAAMQLRMPEHAPQPGVTGDMLEELRVEFPDLSQPVPAAPLAALPRPTSKELPTQIAS